MINSVDDILLYVDKNPNCHAAIGIIKTPHTKKTFLTWAAINRKTGHKHIPFLTTIAKLHPEATWLPLTPKELQIFLKNNRQKAFLLSEKAAKLA